jgi:hypothetical protein
LRNPRRHFAYPGGKNRQPTGSLPLQIIGKAQWTIRHLRVIQRYPLPMDYGIMRVAGRDYPFTKQFLPIPELNFIWFFIAVLLGANLGKS